MKNIYHLPSTLYHKGFTLIELLVAISIIGLLSSFLLANFVGVRQRARDGVRKYDLRQMQSALELYRSDQGTYPILGINEGNFPVNCGGPFTDSLGNTIYMSKVPCDPSTNVSYYYDSPGAHTTYCVRSCLENSNDPDRDELPAKFNQNNPTIGTCTLTDCLSGKSYSLQNP